MDIQSKLPNTVFFIRFKYVTIQNINLGPFILKFV